MGWRIFDCFAAAALFGAVLAFLWFIIQGLQTGSVMLKLDDHATIFIVAAVAAILLLAGIILIIRIFMRLRGW